MKRIPHIIVVLCFSIQCIYSQLVLNPSFEGPVGTATCPPSWYPCGLNSTPDTQPGQFNLKKPAQHGSTYISLVTRESNGADSYEAIGQTLTTPLLKDQCYSFKIYLLCSSEFTFSNFGDPYFFTNSTVLRVWGGDSICKKSELLLKSVEINDNYWREFSFLFKPSANYSHITLEAYYPDPTKRLYGNLCLDNLRFNKTDAIATATQYILVSHATDSVQLFPLSGYSYNWINNTSALSCTTCPYPFAGPINGIMNFTVQLTDANSCPYFQVFQLEKEVVFPDITVSEVLTPNGDGKNDVINFDPKQDCEWSAEIFNRWGDRMCKLNKDQTSWDGNYNGGPCPNGTYYYVLSLNCKTTASTIGKNYTGFIQIVR